MTPQEYIKHHETKIDRLYTEWERIQQSLHEATKAGRHIRSEDLLNYVRSISRVENDLDSSIEVRIAMLSLGDKN